MDRGEQRRGALADARLYLICEAAPAGRPLEEVLAPALQAGVDMVQLREKKLGDDELLAAARVARRLTSAAEALLIINDRPDLALAAEADGVHLGQQDGDLDAARSLLGAELLIGRSTHSPDQIDGAAGADYLGVGPVYATPTKPGRTPVGLELVGYADRHAGLPFFAIGGVHEGNVAEIVAAGAAGVAVVRAIAHAPDPGGAARRLRERLDAALLEGAGVGKA